MLEAIRERHKACTPDYCEWLWAGADRGERNRCDTRVVLEALEACGGAVEDVAEDRDRLAAALRDTVLMLESHSVNVPRAREALRLHDEP